MAPSISNPYPDTGSLEWCLWENTHNKATKASSAALHRNAEPKSSGERGLKRLAEPDVTKERDHKRPRVIPRPQHRLKSSKERSETSPTTVPVTVQIAQPVSLMQFAENDRVFSSTEESSPEPTEIYIDAGESIETDEDEVEDDQTSPACEPPALEESGDLHADEEDVLMRGLEAALAESEDEDAPLGPDDSLFGDDGSLFGDGEDLETSPASEPTQLATPPPSPKKCFGIALPTGTRRPRPTVAVQASQASTAEHIDEGYVSGNSEATKASASPTKPKQPPAKKKEKKVRKPVKRADHEDVAVALRSVLPTKALNLEARFAAAAARPASDLTTAPVPAPAPTSVSALVSSLLVAAQPVVDLTEETKEERIAREKEELARKKEMIARQKLEREAIRKAEAEREAEKWKRLSNEEKNALVAEKRVAAGHVAVLTDEERQRLPADLRRDRLTRIQQARRDEIRLRA